MDLFSKTIVGIRSPASSTVYHTALKRGVRGCYGFLIGTHDEWTRPVFDHALPVLSLSDIGSFKKVPEVLPKYLGAAKELARHADNVLNGIFLAWNTCYLSANRNQTLGLFIDLASALEIPYVAVFPIDGGETIWAESIYFANRFPHTPLPYKRLPRRSAQPQHNARKIIRSWKTALSKPA